MEIQFHLEWLKHGQVSSKVFKLAAARFLFLEYVERISKFVPCRVSGALLRGEQRRMGTRIWVCDRAQGAKSLSSEALAATLESLRDSGTHKLEILIGGADGFSKGELEELKPDLRWSFGPLTFPHELAAVIASEQIYRAWTIIRGLPYHSGH